MFSRSEYARCVEIDELMRVCDWGAAGHGLCGFRWVPNITENVVIAALI